MVRSLQQKHTKPDVALGIEASSAIEKVAISSPIYNLAGQQVDKDYKGIVIVNGKKYLNR